MTEASERWKLFWPSAFAANIAVLAALDCGLPVWRTWPAGDASDFGVATFFFVWTALRALKGTSHE